MERAEWERRFKQRIVDQVGRENGGESLGQSELDGAGFEYLSEHFEDDPEGSADEAMSYWEE
jgi:hypothetical protein